MDFREKLDAIWDRISIESFSKTKEWQMRSATTFSIMRHVMN